MKTWENASNEELRQFEIISMILEKHKKIINYLFDTKNPKLNGTPNDILKNASAFSRGEYVLIKVALDVWSESGNANLTEILNTLDKENFIKVMKGINYLKSNF